MKEWKYRFKRGLASFLTVGMIASGVNVAAYIPVYAVENEAQTTEQKVYKDADAAVLGVSEDLVKQITGMFNGSAKDEAKFVVAVQIENQGDKSKNKQITDDIAEKAADILEDVMKKCPSELFWYDDSSKELGDQAYQCINNPYGGNGKGKPITTNFEFQFAVKDAYKANSKSPISISMQKILDGKNANDAAELDQAVQEIYNGLKKEISAKFTALDGTDDKAKFDQIRFTCKNKQMLEKVEQKIPEIVSSILRDCSSELFWYDQSVKLLKEADYHLSTDGSYRWKTLDDYIENNGVAFFYLDFAVKKAFRYDKSNPISIWTYQIKKSKNAVDSILGEYAGKGLSDYEILCGFRDALSGNYKQDAEQFAQAFEYLCNRTFTSGTVKYCTVSGTVNGEEHTWNLVGIDGQTYLVDVANFAESGNERFFLAGVTGFTKKDGEYTYEAGGKKYVQKSAMPGSNSVISVEKYRLEQTEFRFVGTPAQKGVVGDPDLPIEVEGNIGNVEFMSSKPAIATIIPVGKNRANVHMVAPGEVEIQAMAGRTEDYRYTRRYYTLHVEARKGGSTTNPGGNTGGSGSGGGGSTGGSTGGGGGTGGSTGGGGTLGSMAVSGDVGVRELLPQVDFCIESGTDKIIKSVGAPDFTITAWGQVNDSKVTYASSDPAVATVNAETGTVHIVGAGTATISATASETKLHRAEKCEYTLEVL